MRPAGHPVRDRLRRREDGAVAIIAAVSLLMIVVAAAMVLDFGIVRVDRQTNKSAADSAAIAGLHGLDTGNGEAHPYVAVCQAIRYLKANDPRFANLAGTWTDGDGNPTADPEADGCTSSSLYNTVCEPADPGSRTTWARFEGTADSDISVWIQSGYLLSEGGTFAEESLPALQSDGGDPDEKGCDQLAVVITQHRTPGLGSLAGASDLVSRVRSVGRILVGEEGKGAVALLLLERNNCRVLNADGSGSILVTGSGAQPGMIHVDSLGNNQIDVNGDGVTDRTGSCNSVQVINGSHDYSIVATQSVTPPLKDAVISVRALTNEPGANPAKASDPSPQVVAEPDPPNQPVARGLVTRSPVDERWLSGVRAVVNSSTNYAKTTVALPAEGPSVTYEETCDGAAGPAPETLAETGTVVFNCAEVGRSYPSVSLAAERVIFTGRMYITDEFEMPNAHEVYVRGAAGGDAISILGAGSLQMHTETRTIPNPDPDDPRPVCTDANLPGRAKLVIGAGNINGTASGGHMQLCHTSIIMMGNQADACLPGSFGTPPTVNSCDSFINFAGGSLDWTAPDENGLLDPAEQGDWDLLEDLALWTEAEDGSPSTQHRIVGGGLMRLAGVFMIPNGNEVTIGGTGDQVVTNSQYVARRLTVAGTGTMTMTPDPADSFLIPIIGGFQLVR